MLGSTLTTLNALDQISPRWRPNGPPYSTVAREAPASPAHAHRGQLEEFWPSTRSERSELCSRGSREVEDHVGRRRSAVSNVRQRSV